MGLSNTLSMEEFVCMVEDLVMEQLGSDFFSQKQTVVKNNGVNLISLIIRKKKELVAPCIYLNSYYLQYETGRKVKDICDEIIKIYINVKRNGRDEFKDITYQYEEMKSNIIFRLTNFDKNKDMLESVPHFKVLDFAVTFHCLVREDEDGIGTIRITKDHCKQWDVTIEDLYFHAMKNTPCLFPPMIRPMEDVMLELMRKEVLSFAMNDLNNLDGLEKQKEIELAAKEFMQMLNYENPKCKVDMYVLSNSRGINGASCILYPEILSGFSDEINSDFYILPSSIHEMILVPVVEHLGIQQLKEMVMEINQTQVPMDEVLSDQIYCYSKTKKQMDLIA